MRRWTLETLFRIDNQQHSHSYRGLMGFRGQHPMVMSNNCPIIWFMIHITLFGRVCVWQLGRSIRCATYSDEHHSSGTTLDGWDGCIIRRAIRKCCLHTPSARNDLPNQCIHKSHLACSQVCARRYWWMSVATVACVDLVLDYLSRVERLHISCSVFVCGFCDCTGFTCFSRFWE